MKLLQELNESVDFLIEDSKAGKKYMIEGPFLSYDTPNKNGRLYPESVMRKAVGKYNEEFVSKNRAISELGHPPNPTVNLERVSHVIKSLNFNESTKAVIGKAEIIETPMGKIARNLMEAGVKLGVSSRGLGSVKALNGLNHVQEDFVISAIDIVGDPSGHGCTVEGIYENADWVLKNGEWVQLMVDIQKKQIDESVLLKKYNSFLKNLANGQYK